jgi:hypothetical protein
MAMAVPPGRGFGQIRKKLIETNLVALNLSTTPPKSAAPAGIHQVVIIFFICA